MKRAQSKKNEIGVLDKNGHLFKIIKRKVRFEMIGNFCPGFVVYKGKEYLAKSDKGDLSDPFRRDESYLNHLYIQIED